MPKLNDGSGLGDVNDLVSAIYSHCQFRLGRQLRRSFGNVTQLATNHLFQASGDRRSWVCSVVLDKLAKYSQSMKTCLLLTHPESPEMRQLAGYMERAGGLSGMNAFPEPFYRDCLESRGFLSSSLQTFFILLREISID